MRLLIANCQDRQFKYKSRHFMIVGIDILTFCLTSLQLFGNIYSYAPRVCNLSLIYYIVHNAFHFICLISNMSNNLRCIMSHVFTTIDTFVIVPSQFLFDKKKL